MNYIFAIIETWRKELIKMLPPVMRGESIIDFLSSLVEPVQTLTDETAVFEVNTRTRLRYNGKVMVLQAALNEIHGITAAPFIRIETNRDPQGIPSFIYDESDGVPTMFFFDEGDAGPPAYLLPNPEDANIIPDFRVLIPSGIWTQDLEDTIRADVQLYKIAGQLFEIIQY